VSDAGKAESDGAAPDSAAGESRCGFVAIVGAPNVGKSTLVNRLVGSKVSIVSPKVQTTRSRILGIALRGACQIVLVDNPGFFEPRSRLDAAMVNTAWRSMGDADVIVLLVDSGRGIDAATAEVAQWLKQTGRQGIAVLNKVDVVAKPLLLGLAAELQRMVVFSRILMVSALRGDGVDDLGDHLAHLLPAGPWLFPADEVSDAPISFLAAEITREKLFWQLQQEVPYACAVRTELCQERADGSLRIEQIIIVERSGQKGILIGKGGQQLRRIGEAARRELAHLIDRPVHLFLRVQVREKWRESPLSQLWHRLEPPPA
jgi:GTP-binding protein Era